jgi:hypothetical protein
MAERIECLDDVKLANLQSSSKDAFKEYNDLVTLAKIRPNFVEELKAILNKL